MLKRQIDNLVVLIFIGMLNILKTCFIHLQIVVIAYFTVYLKQNISEKEFKHFTFNSKNARKVIFCTIDP